MRIDTLIKDAAQKIAKAKRPVSFSGAGLSAESGIATFRDPSDEEALWSAFNPQQLASQEGFRAAPETVIDWYNWRRKTLANSKPNAAHITLAKLTGWMHITQNVDDLLERARESVSEHKPSGVISEILHLHGTLLEDHCNANCGNKERVDLHQAPTLRQCHCGDYMRPSVIWFGEALSEKVLKAATYAAQTTDLMLVVGTSAVVYPAAGLVDIALAKGADIIVVNPECGVVAPNVIELNGPAGEILPQLF